MKKAIILLVIPLVFSSCRMSVSLRILASNPSKTDLKDIPLVIKRSDLGEKMQEIPDENLLLTNAQELIPFQLDDLDGDGAWDELFTLINLSAGEAASIELIEGNSENKVTPKTRTNIRMARKVSDEEFELVESANRLQGTDTKHTIKFYQYEGPGWENDKIAFRNYFDERNGIDIFGKTTPEMCLDKVGVGGSYHELQEWGMDILKVGNSLGAGAIALLYQDSLYRVTAPEGASFQLVKNGPLRSIFDLDFKEVQLADKKVGVKHRIVISAGVYGYQSQVSLQGNTDGIHIVSGIVNMLSEEAYILKSEGMTILYSHDDQAFVSETLGMALMASDQYYQSWYKTKDTGEGIVQTYAMVLNPDNEGKAIFHFLAGWELTDYSFNMKRGFDKYLLKEVNRQRITQ